MTTIGVFDCETNAYISVIDMLPQGYQVEGQRYIRARIEAFQAGLSKYPLLDAGLKLVDPNLQVRHDYINGAGPIIERFSEDAGGFTLLMPWPCKWQSDELLSLNEVQDMLRSCDMWRNGLDPFAAADFNKREAYRKRRADEAKKRREENEQKAQQAVDNAIDSLGSKRKANFLRVTEAVRTGETIWAHGDDARRLERLNTASLKAQAEESQS